jgi:hypothetical protein
MPQNQRADHAHRAGAGNQNVRFHQSMLQAKVTNCTQNSENAAKRKPMAHAFAAGTAASFPVNIGASDRDKPLE